MEPVQTPRVFSNRYELTHLIARGGMAQVYRARDRLLDRPVALKVLFPELSVDRAFVERFRREAQAAANLSQPNIVPVFDWGEDNGTYFIVMEFVDGRPLSALLRASGTLTPERTADIGAHVASALAYAHRHGVVHRDVKPGNVLITDDGQVKVTDFGIARAVNTEESLTQTGAVMGTAAYFSPEQAEGVGVDSRSDLYSLGVVLFEMLTGRTPFLGDTPVAVASKHVRDQPPLPRDINPTVPPQLEAVVMKAMAKSPDRRYGTAEELRADLLRFTEGLPVLAGDPAATSVQAAVGATVAVGAVAAGAATTTAQPRIRPQHVDDVPEEDDEEAARRRTKRLWIILGVLLLALAVVGILLARTLGASSTFAMPNVVGQTVASATTTLEDKGLTIGATHRSHSSQPVNTVINSDPSSGTEVKKGQAVTLTVSSGQQAAQVLVPNVVGQQLTDAATILNGVNLGYSVKPEQSSKPSGQVLAQNPVAGSTAGAGTDVVLTVSTQTTTTVPNVVGQNQTTAGSMLAQNNLTVGNVTNQCSTSNVASGLVVSSNPGAGTTLPPQSPVALVVSTGPCQVVPPVVGLTPAAATTTLAAQTPSLTAVPVNTINCTSAQNGTVVNTNPAVGAQVGSSLSVTIYVCNLSGTTTTTTTSPGTSSTTSTSSTSTTTTSTAPPG